jgi:hypothetical protein
MGFSGNGPDLAFAEQRSPLPIRISISMGLMLANHI